MAHTRRHYRACIAALLVGLGFLFKIVDCAPLESEQQQQRLDLKEEEGSLASAIDAVTRAKKDAMDNRAPHSLAHYRDLPSEYEEDGDQSDDGAVEELLADKLGDSSIDLTQLAKEMALDILMEEADAGEQENGGHSSSSPDPVKRKFRPGKTADYTPIIKRKFVPVKSIYPTADKRKFTPNKHDTSPVFIKTKFTPGKSTDSPLTKRKFAPGRETSELDEQRKKRLATILEQLMEEDEPFDDGGNDIFADPEEIERQEDLANFIQALASEGLTLHEMEKIMSELDFGESSIDDVGSFSAIGMKKKRGEWKTLPRSSLRWGRFVQASSGSGETPRNAEALFTGRGIHRMAPSSPSFLGDVASKRVLQQQTLKTSLKTKNASKPKMASLPLALTMDDEDDSHHREKRSITAPENSTAIETISPPVSEDASKQNGTDVRSSHSGGVIRKKSVDWDDYFGFDKRNANDSNAASESQYYRAIAGALAYRRKRVQRDHSGHSPVMKKRFNRTSSRHPSATDDVEEAINAAVLAAQLHEDRQREEAEWVAGLVESLDAGQLDDMTTRLAYQLAEAISDDQNDEDDEEYAGVSVFRERNLMKRGDGEERKKRKKKISVNEEDEKRRKRQLRQSFERGLQQTHGDEGDCPVAQQVVTTCNIVSHLYGGYNAVLGDACYRHQACAICSDDESACDVKFQQRAMKVCGKDLLCQSHSRHLLVALGRLDQVQAEYFRGKQAQLETLCFRDACLTSLFKRR